MNAIELLEKAVSIMKERASERGEEYQNVMSRVTTLFSEQTGVYLNNKQGWIFMQCLKTARAEIKEKEDDLVDLVAYKALELCEKD